MGKMKNILEITGESIIIDQENVQDLEQEITATLSPMENQVLEYYLAGNGYGEIARIMGKTPKSIDNALQRIKKKLMAFW